MPQVKAIRPSSPGGYKVPSAPRGSLAGAGTGTGTVRGKRHRTRTGCWNCRRKRKKCDEQRPVCTDCAQKGVACEWGLRLSFRPENLETLPASHPSLQRKKAEWPLPRNIKIIDVTSEIIRDYWNETESGTEGHGSPFAAPSRSLTSLSAPRYDTQQWSAISSPPIPLQTRALSRDDRHASSTAKTLPPTPGFLPSGHAMRHEGVSMGGPSSTLASPETAPISSPHSYDLIQSAAAHLLHLSAPALTPAPVSVSVPDAEPPQTGLELPGSTVLQAAVSGDHSMGSSPASDGVFLPGSAYLEFHSALRNHTLHAARSNFPSRSGTPDCPPPARERDGVDGLEGYHAGGSSLDHHEAASETATRDGQTLSAVPTPESIELSPQQEYELWKNWVDEIAPWLDKFDNQRHFGCVLPPLAQQHPHLRFSMLALSARQLERKNPSRAPSVSLALYQEAIHDLAPQLQLQGQGRTTAVVASCVVLCVLEMMSCSPKMWRRHLDGCASLLLAAGIDGASGGLEQALFWCFARMDLCGGFISDERTIIPVECWLPRAGGGNGSPLLFYRSLGFDMYANYVVYLCARVMDLLAGGISSSNNTNTMGDATSAQRWSELFGQLRDWYDHRPAEMKPILDSSSSSSSSPLPTADPVDRPFPILLFGSSSAISGNQLYHTGALLMLQQKPRRVRLPAGTRSILWHARRISAISISNTNHACWTNCVQPLWFAGRVMSHPAEHRAILETYERIERDTGWGARWRADDLREYWGDLGAG